MRPHEKQEPYRAAFSEWVTAHLPGPWSPDELQTFEIDGRQFTVQELLAELAEDTARVFRSRPIVCEVLDLDEGATWAVAARAAHARLPEV